MARKIVTVDEGLHLPAAVQAQLKDDLNTEFTAKLTLAQTAATNASTSATEADTARDEAVAAAATATAPTETAVASMLSTSTSAVWPLRPTSSSGLYSARPAATAVPPGSSYFATNVPEHYVAESGVWVVRGAGGNELGYAQSATVFSHGTTTPTDVPGLTTTFVVGERPVQIKFNGDFTHSVAGGIVVLYLVIDGTIVARPNGPAHAANAWQTISRDMPVRGLTPGTTHTAKIQIAAIGGTGSVQGDATNPMFIQVVTL